MKPNKILLIYNPYSGKAILKQHISAILEILSDDDTAVTIFPTKHQNHARELTERYAAEYDCVICCGGDGTLNEVINGLMLLPNPPPIGYIPSGTVNDFASNFSLAKTPTKCAESIKNGTPTAFDVGTFNDKAFSYFAGFGIFTDVSHQTPQEMKNVLGRTAYILEGIKRLSSIPSYNVTIKTEKETISGDFLFGMVTNSITVGGFKKLSCGNIQLDDGLFEITLAHKPKSNADIQTLLQCILTGTSSPHCLYRANARTVEIVSEQAVEWNLDGEYGGLYSSATIENHQQALQIIVDKKDSLSLE